MKGRRMCLILFFNLEANHKNEKQKKRERFASLVPNFSYQVSVLQHTKSEFIYDRKSSRSKANSWKICLDTASNPTLHALILHHPPEILMAEKEKKHVNHWEPIATFTMKGQYRTIQTSCLYKLKILKIIIKHKLARSTPTRCSPTADAAHVLAMQPVFPGICEGQ